LDDPQSKGYALLGTSRALAAVGERTKAISAAPDALTALEAFGDPQADECRSELGRLERAAASDLAATNDG
jgi:hypothetical protein